MYEPLKNPGNRFRMSSNCRSNPPFSLCLPCTKVAVSAICHRLIVVSRGLKLLRPIVSTVVPLCWTTASGLAVFASPGSSSRAYWNLISLNSFALRMLVHAALNVRVFTSDAPVCSKAFWAPPLSNPSPVKF